jgi:hypothetical protein
MDEIPIACTLPEAELRERERTVLAALGAQVRKVEARPDGYALELAATDEAVAAATTFIQLERRCCQFLRFELTIDAATGPVRLTLTGPQGARDFLATWLESAVASEDKTMGPRAAISPTSRGDSRAAP